MKVRIGGLITADKFYRIDARLTGNGESLSLCLSALERSKHDDGGDNEPNSPEHKYPPLIRWRRGLPSNLKRKDRFISIVVLNSAHVPPVHPLSGHCLPE